jgi:hypothetical protein
MFRALLFMMLLGMGVCYGVASCGESVAESLSYTKVSYRVVEDWSGGTMIGRAIVLDSYQPTEEFGRNLALTLQDESKNYSHATIMVFSSDVAASLRKEGMLDKLAPNLQKTYDEGFLGTFFQNKAQNRYKFNFFPESVAALQQDDTKVFIIEL